MQERVDFLKIEEKGKLKSVIEIGLIIPVTLDVIEKIDISKEP